MGQKSGITQVIPLNTEIHNSLYVILLDKEINYTHFIICYQDKSLMKY